MKTTPYLIVGPKGRLISKQYFPNQWSRELDLQPGQAIAPDLFNNSIKKYNEGQIEEFTLQVSGTNISLIVEPSGENFHISFELKNKKPHRERNDSLNRYQLLVEAASDVIFEVDLEGRFTYMNPAAVKMSGLDAMEIVGQPFTRLVKPDWHQKVVDFYLDQIQHAKKSTYLEFPGVNVNGDITWLGQKVQLLEDEEGLVGMMAVARDITERIKTEEVLKRSEEKYRGMLHGLQFGLVEVDNDERIVYVNEPMCKITGYDRDELMGRIASDVLVDESTRDIIDRENGRREDGVASVYEISIRHKSGQPIWSLISGAPIIDVHGNQVGSIGIHMDVTQKKQEEFILREMSKKLSARNAELRKKQNFLNGINHFVTKLLSKEDIHGISWEIAEGLIEHFGFEDCVIYILNEEKRQLDQIAAYGPKMEKGRLVSNPISVPLGKGIVGAVAKSGKVEVIDDTSKDDRYIVDDIPRLSELCVPIIADGEVIGIIDSEHEEAGFFKREHVDTLVTIANLASNRLKNAKSKERQLKAESELIDSERKLRTILDSALDAVVSIDSDGLVTEWNHQAEIMFGFTAQEAIGKPLTNTIIPNRHSVSHNKGMKHYLKTGEGPVLNQKIEITALRKGGEEFPIELAIVSVVMKGVHSFTAFMSDITVQKQVHHEMEKALSKERELNELKSRFVAMTSHEFRTPLTTIKQNIDLVSFKLENKHPEEFLDYKKYLDRVESEIRRVTSLMNDILMMGRIDSGKIEVRKQAADLKYFCQCIIEQHVSSRLDDRGIDFEVTGVPRPVEFDGDLFDHVIQNLMSNAFKYSEGKANPKITLRYDKLDVVHLHVQDFGIGIPKKDQKGLFQSFYRATNVQNIQGSGLGLSIVKEFVELHGGVINVNSDKGKGSEFIVEIPFK